MKKTTMRTFRAFETDADARTFMKFLTSISYTGIDIEYIQLSKVFRVWFNY